MAERKKFKVTAQVEMLRTVTVTAATKEAAVEKAAKRFEDQGIETISFRVEPVETPSL